MSKRYDYTPSTGHKSFANLTRTYDKIDTSYNTEYKPSPFSLSHGRKTGKFNDKVSSLRQTLDDLISCVSEKRSIQRSGAQRVYNVNNELLQDLSRSAVVTPRQVYSTIQQPMKASYRTSTFGDVSSLAERKKSFFDMENQQNEENIRLREQLNNQRRSSNELMNRLRNLRFEQDILRDNTVQMSHEPNEYELEQNRRLKEELRYLNQRPSQGYTMDDLMRQFAQLKEQNQMLRDQTIRMLKSKSFEKQSTPTYVY